MEDEGVYQNVEHKDIKGTFGPQTQNHKQVQGKAKNCRGSGCLVLIAVGLGVICVLLLVFFILQHITITAERDLIKSLQDNNTDLMQKKGWFFMSNEFKNWSDSRQYCMDRGADLVIINTEEKQRFISSFTTESVWIGLSDTENEGNMAWVDNSPLKQGFWVEGEPNNLGGNEDCIVLNAASPILINWNDLSCNNSKNGICEKY